MHDIDPVAKKSLPFSWLDVPRAIWHFLDADRKRWATLNIVLLLVLFYEIIPPLVLGRIVDFFTTHHRGESLVPFYSLAIFLGVSHTAAALIRLASKNRLSRIAIRARTRARVYGFERLVNLPLQWHAQENTGNKIERVFAGSQAILEWTRTANNGIFPIAITFAGVLGAFLFLSPRFLLFLLGYVFIFFWIEKRYNRRLNSLSDQITQSRQRSSGRYIEGSGNILAIKALGTERSMHLQVKQTEEEAQHLMLARSDTSAKKWYFFQTLSGVAFSIFAVLVGLQVLNGVITVGMILVFFTYFNKLREAANDATDLSTRLIELKAELGAMMPIFQAVGNVKTGEASFPKLDHSIRISDGSFAYPSGQVGLAGLNFGLAQGESVGVAGPSGGGKSTLVKILLGLYELHRGSFVVGQRSYYDINHEDMIGHIAVALQETELFNMSLQDNITLLRDVDQAKLMRAVRLAQLEPVITKLPQGLGTLIGERGYKLSGGERQRLGLARAIYKDAPIMILDEATSSLDSQTEKKIMDGLFAELGQQRTILIIAHRISTLKDTDRVVYIDQGAIIEEGTYQALIQNPLSKLAQLYALQAGGQDLVR